MAARQPRRPRLTRGKLRPLHLTERQKQFARNIVAGMSQRTAYLEAGFSMTRMTGSITRLMRDPMVASFIERLYERQRLRLDVTMNRLVLDYCRAQDLAVETGNAPALVAATTGLAKLMGFLREDREGDVNIYINRPLRDPGKEIELTAEEWVTKWAPKSLEKPNGSAGNGHDGSSGKD